jgi:hypothetical protein
MATATLTITISSAASTIVATPVTGLISPVVPGTKVADIVVSPADWQGAISLSGPDAAFFAISGAPPNSLVAAVQLAARTYTVQIDTLP